MISLFCRALRSLVCICLPAFSSLSLWHEGAPSRGFSFRFLPMLEIQKEWFENVSSVRMDQSIQNFWRKRQAIQWYLSSLKLRRILLPIVQTVESPCRYFSILSASLSVVLNRRYSKRVCWIDCSCFPCVHLRDVHLIDKEMQFY